MAQNIQRSRGRGQGYRFDRGGTPSEFGPFIGVVRNNIDPTRSGRLQVYIEQFSGDDPDDQTLWRTVSYIPPFYGTTNPDPRPDTGVGGFTVNLQSYGMWFTPPDIGTQVICFFAGGDPNQGYYTGCVPVPGINHMIPAIGASRRYDITNPAEASYLESAAQLPVTEINDDNVAISENPRFFDQTKPVHSVLAAILMQQGLIRDPVRGPITSNSQRESPSAVFGVSTPGKAIYQGGIDEREIKRQLDRNELQPQDIKVIARRGGHSIVMDDGDVEGRDTLVRIRTAKGHQITMSDDGDCFFIIHANGQTWVELGKQGTVDVFSTNSVNVRTQGTINLHADRDINMFAGGSINMKSTTMKMEADASLDLTGTGQLKIYSKNLIGIRSDGSLALKNTSNGSWDGGSSLNLQAGCINLNSGSAAPVQAPQPLQELDLADTEFVINQGWQVKAGALKTIVTRAPTHEPYPYHNQGVANRTSVSAGPVTALAPSALQKINSLSNVLVTNGLDASSFLAQNRAEIAVGSLDTTQVTALLAQASLDVDQDYDVVTDSKGIGKFGFTATQLEGSGFLKPGTVQTYLQDPAQLTTVLSSPSVWTGKAGVTTLNNLLVDPNLQDVTQNEIMISALDGLRAVGLVTGSEVPNQLSALVQTASKFGVNDTVAWVNNAAPANLVNQINSTAKNAQYAVNFVDQKASDTLTGAFSLGGFTDTIERGSLDQAVRNIISNPKIPTPDFGSGLYSSTPNSDLTYSGDDPIVLQRINAERQRRGLPPLPASA